MASGAGTIERAELNLVVDLAALPVSIPANEGPPLGSSADRQFRLRKMISGIAAVLPQRRRPPHVDDHVASARRWYGLWLRHALRLHQVTGRTVAPRVLVELGPGDFLGMSLAALLSGADRAYALDAHPYANPAQNLSLFDELIELFHRREPIPHTPDCNDLPHVDDAAFPAQAFDAERLAAALAPDRVAKIRMALAGGARDATGPLVYVAPWNDSQHAVPEQADLIVSHSVLEYVPDVAHTYRTLAGWLVAGGHMSHFLDYGAIGIAPQWDGHRAYGALGWRFVRGGHSYVINRVGHDGHAQAARGAGLTIAGCIRYTQGPTVPAVKLARAFRTLSADDLATRYALFVLRKDA